MSYYGGGHFSYGGMPVFTSPGYSPCLPPPPGGGMYLPYGLPAYGSYPQYGLPAYGSGFQGGYGYGFGVQPYFPAPPAGIYGSASLPTSYGRGDPGAFGSVYSSTLYNPGMWGGSHQHYGYGHHLFPQSSTQSLPFQYQHGLIFDAGQTLRTRKIAEKLEKEPSVKKLVAKARPNLYSSVPEFLPTTYNPPVSFPITLYSSAESVLAAGPPGTIMAVQMSPPSPPPPAFMSVSGSSATVRRSLSPVQLSSPAKVPERSPAKASPAKATSITASPLVVTKKPAVAAPAKPAASPASTPIKALPQNPISPRPAPEAAVKPSPRAAVAKTASPQEAAPKPASRPPQGHKPSSTSVMGSVSSPSTDAPEREMPPRKPIPAVPQQSPAKKAPEARTPVKPSQESTPKKDSPASIQSVNTPASVKSATPAKSTTATPSSVKSTNSAHKLAGVGLLFVRERNGWMVRQVIPGSPAGATNQIKVGDNLWSIDGTEVGGMVSMFDVSKCLLGEEGTDVRLKFKRGKKAFNVSLLRSNEFLGQEGSPSAKKVLELGDGLQV